MSMKGCHKMTRRALLVVSLTTAMVFSGLGVREALASHCTNGGPVVTDLSQLSSTPNNTLSCNTVNARSDGTSVSPGFSPFQLFKAASGSFGTSGSGSAELLSVTLASFINLEPGAVTGNMFGQMQLFSGGVGSTDVLRMNFGFFDTDARLQSVIIPCGNGTGSGSSGGAGGECPNASEEANTSSAFGVNPATTIESFATLDSAISGITPPTNAGNLRRRVAGIESFRQNFSDDFRFANVSNNAAFADFGQGFTITCGASSSTISSTCSNFQFTQFTGNTTQDPTNDGGNSAAPFPFNGTAGGIVSVRTAFAVGTLASGLQTAGSGGLISNRQFVFPMIFHQLISQGRFQMDQLGSFRANHLPFMPVATMPTGLSLGSQVNFLLSQSSSLVVFRAQDGGQIGNRVDLASQLSPCFPGIARNDSLPVALHSSATGSVGTGFGGAFLFLGAFNDFGCRPLTPAR